VRRCGGMREALVERAYYNWDWDWKDGKYIIMSSMNIQCLIVDLNQVKFVQK